MPIDITSGAESAGRMTRDQMLAHIRTANEVALEAARHGHHPFGCVLVGPDNRILMRQGNISTVRHSEAELCRRAAEAYPADFLWTCTLVVTGEPCAMCTATLYWANIGRLVYGFEETQLLAETGNHPENPTMSLAARTVLGSGQKQIEVFGPFPEIEDEVLAPHRTFWKSRQST
jgi:tRNA(Arg) A34 adenosine deaminase TadA